MTKARLELPLLLPDLPDRQDPCISRLRESLEGKAGIESTHVVRDGDQTFLCLHYDPGVVSLAQVERAARGAGLEITKRFGHIILPLRAIDAEDAAHRIEVGLLALPGVSSANVNLASQKARVEFDRERTTEAQVQLALGKLGYSEEVPAAATAVASARTRWFLRQKELGWSLACGGFLLTAWVGEKLNLPPAIALGLYITCYGFGSFDLLRHTLPAFVRGQFVFDIDLLMLLAATGAAALGQWAEGGLLLFLFSLAHALEHFALDRARGAIRALAELSPAMAQVIEDGETRDVPVERVRPGDLVVVRPGARIPVDGTVKSGESTVNQAPVTGESTPVDKLPGSEVFAGTINGDGSLQVESTRAVGDRTLDRVIRLVEEAQTQKAPTEQFTQRFERIFVPLVLLGVVALMLAPPMLGTLSWHDSLYRGLAVLVAASPCALALGTPAAVLAGIAQAARRGVLIKGGAHLENLGRVRALAFDKTGTLTVGRPQVAEVIALDGDAKELLSVAAAVEQHSQHPLAAAVVERARAENLTLPPAGDVKSITGRGVRSEVAGSLVEIGSLKMWPTDTIPLQLSLAVERQQVAGRSYMVVRSAGRWLGVLGLADQPRSTARRTLQQLRSLGLRTLIMLTGDNDGVAQTIGRTLGLDDVRSELMPEDKLRVLRELLAVHGRVAMVGDGVNDAPALAHATVGIAMGGAGTAVALETADVALMGDDLGQLPFAVGLSRAARRVIQQNVAIALTAVSALLVGTTVGAVGIGLSVLLHEASTLVVVANALRLLRFSLPIEPALESSDK